MSASVFSASRARAKTFGWDGGDEAVPLVPEPDPPAPFRPVRMRATPAFRARGRPLAVGLWASFLTGARRTLQGLDWLKATGARIEQVVLIDDSGDPGGVAGVAAEGLPNVTLLAASEVRARAAQGVYGAAHERPESRRCIAFGRTVVHHELYARMPKGAVAWILDDDLDLQDLRWEGTPIDGAGLMRAVARCSDADVAVGGIHGDPPLRPAAGIRTALLDLLHAAQGGAGTARDGADLYHDLSSLRTDHLEAPAPLGCSAPEAARAVAAGRPALRQAPARLPYGDPPTRGGNTLVLAPQTLRDYPNAAPWLGDGIARRADSLWLLALRDLGPRTRAGAWRIRAAPLSVAQRRIADNPSSVADLAPDIEGWAFLRAMERVGWRRAPDAAWLRRFERAFVSARRFRLSLLRANALRVQGLCDILAVRHPALAELARVEQIRRDVTPTEVDRLSRAERERVREALAFVHAYPELACSYRAGLARRSELAARRSQGARDPSRLAPPMLIAGDGA